MVAPVFATNCYVVAPASGHECIVIDAGAGVAEPVAAAVAEHGLTPVAVLATHGHVDHTWDAADLCERFDVPLRLHEADVYRLADPFGTLGGGALVAALAQLGLHGDDYRAPARVEPVSTPHRGQSRLELAGLPVTWLHAPGHTQGASLVSVPRAPSSSSDLVRAEGFPRDLHPSRTVFSGDVLFAGTIGRTDLPGGDDAEMATTLAEPVGTLAGDVLVLPG
ncbi:MAG: MBL fold metallo-hydrolase, partial [Actinomycetales bacterium]|nr:MBL fold metallo-hydrolase [Actinomycetales bacterium]